MTVQERREVLVANDDTEGAEMALDDETYHYLSARAEARGRSIKSRDRAVLLRRILPSRRYRGHPLLGWNRSLHDALPTRPQPHEWSHVHEHQLRESGIPRRVSHAAATE